MRQEALVTLGLAFVTLSGCIGAPSAETQLSETDAKVDDKTWTGPSGANSSAGQPLEDGRYRAQVMSQAGLNGTTKTLFLNDTVDPAPPYLLSGFVVTDGCCLSFGAGIQVSLLGVGDSLPKDVPLEISLSITWENSQANSAELYPVVRFPDFCMDGQWMMEPPRSPISEQGRHTRNFAFKYYVSSLSPPIDWCGTTEYRVGVAAVDNVVTSGLPYTLSVRISQFPGFLTDGVAYAVTVPDDVESFRLVPANALKTRGIIQVFDATDAASLFHYDRGTLAKPVPPDGLEVETPEAGEYVVYANWLPEGYLAVESSDPRVTVTTLRVETTMQIITLDGASTAAVVVPKGLVGIFMNLACASSPAGDVAFTGQGKTELVSTKGVFQSIDLTAWGCVQNTPAGDLFWSCFVNCMFTTTLDGWSPTGPWQVATTGTGVPRGRTDVMVGTFSYVREGSAA